ncbi:hypothetical protein T05_10757 [Trichinella murrelli]|uniref:EB domain-containing protein n=1 Tax=Trichinella murrelli TaxID=144512 RepID=A0A0V0TXJ6_9BILA|nr:hypothetical protein T05_10757 [Trichinella murrelli]
MLTAFDHSLDQSSLALLNMICELYFKAYLKFYSENNFYINVLLFGKAYAYTVLMVAINRIFVQASNVCVQQKDCEGRKVCVNNICVRAKALGKKCFVDNDCGYNRICKYKICWQPEDSSCYRDGDCPKGDTSASQIGTIGQRCASEGRCYTANAFCLYNYCQCKPNSVYDGVKCIQLAELGEPCGEENAPCRAQNSKCIDGTCQCIQNYVLQGQECKMVKKLDLGQFCMSDEQCAPSYSICERSAPNEQGRCACRQQTAKQDNMCRPLAYNCLVGSAYIADGKVKKCVVRQIKDEVSYPVTDKGGCPENYYCVSMGSLSAKELKGSYILEEIGICCPEITPTCPVGEPEPVAANYCESECPKKTHFCLKDENMVGVATCCLKPCLWNNVYINKSCTVPLRIGEACEKQSECILNNANCEEVEKGVQVCACSKRDIEFKGKCIEPKCPSQRQPLMSNGQIVRCNPYTAPCKSIYRCDEKYGICCPR